MQTRRCRQRRAARLTKNWAGNITYSAARVVAPRPSKRAQEPGRCGAPTGLGTRHSFSRVADTDGRCSRRSCSTASSRSASAPSPSKPGSATAGSAARSTSMVSRFPTTHRCPTSPSEEQSRQRPTGRASEPVARRIRRRARPRASGWRARATSSAATTTSTARGRLGTLGFVARVTSTWCRRSSSAKRLRRPPLATVEARLHDKLVALGYSTSLLTLWAERGVDAGLGEVVGRPVETASGRGSDGAAPPDPGRGHGELHRAGRCARAVGRAAAAFRLGFSRAGATSSSRSTRSRASMRVDALRALRSLGPLLTPLLLTSELRAVERTPFG